MKYSPYQLTVNWLRCMDNQDAIYDVARHLRLPLARPELRVVELNYQAIHRPMIATIRPIEGAMRSRLYSLHRPTGLQELVS